MLVSLCRRLDYVALNHPEGNIDGNPLAPQQVTSLCSMYVPNEAALPQHMPQPDDCHESKSWEGSNRSCLSPTTLKQLASRITDSIAHLHIYIYIYICGCYDCIIIFFVHRCANNAPKLISTTYQSISTEMASLLASSSLPVYGLACLLSDIASV